MFSGHAGNEAGDRATPRRFPGARPPRLEGTERRGDPYWRRRLHTLGSGHLILDTGIALVRGDPGAQDLHRPATAGTGQGGGSWPQEGGHRYRTQLEQHLQQVDQALAVGMQEAVVPSAAEALGQDMAQEEPEEVGTGERAGVQLAGLAVLIPEGHFASFAGEDVLLLEHAAVQIAAEVDQCLFAGTDGGAVDDPLHRRARRREPGLRERREELRAKDLGEGFLGEEVGLALAAGTGFGVPPAVFGIDRCGRHGQVHMGMVVQAPGVGMQHRDRSGGALQPPIVAGEGVEGFPTALQQRAVDRALVKPRQFPQFGRNGEGHQEVVGGHLTLQLALQPLLAFVMLAVRTRTVAAGMRHEALFGTVLALHLHPRAVCAAAGGNCRKGLMMAG